MTLDSQYDESFYQTHHGIAYVSATKLIPLLKEWLGSQSVVDVGCGQGAWLLAASESGISDLVGMDGPWVDPRKMRERGIRFSAVDLAKPVPVDRRYDLVLCIEVAEHLPESRADGLVADLCRLADAVVFSAAVPFQGGTNHINEQRASYWAARFAEHGYQCFDLIRPRFWNDEEFGWWYRQNALVYAKGDAAARLGHVSRATSQGPLDIVHPVAYESKLGAALRIQAQMNRSIQHPTFRQLLGYGVRWARGRLSRQRT